jgi:hypothetical protein
MKLPGWQDERAAEDNAPNKKAEGFLNSLRFILDKRVLTVLSTTHASEGFCKAHGSDGAYQNL